MGWFYGFLIGVFTTLVGSGVLAKFVLNPVLEKLYEAVKGNKDLVDAIDRLLDQLAEAWPPEKGGE